VHVRQNAMMAFALCSSFEVAGALKIPPPLPRTVQFSPKPDSPGYYEMRQAKFFQDGSVRIKGKKREDEEITSVSVCILQSQKASDLFSNIYILMLALPLLSQSYVLLSRALPSCPPPKRCFWTASSRCWPQWSPPPSKTSPPSTA